MTMSEPALKNRLLQSLPQPVQETLVAYGKATNLSPQAVVEFAIIHFLDLEDHLPEDYPQQQNGDDSVLAGLPSFLRHQVEAYAQADPQMPPEFVIELALVFLQDPDAITFDECYPGLRRGAVELLQAYRSKYQAHAA